MSSLVAIVLVIKGLIIKESKCHQNNSPVVCDGYVKFEETEIDRLVAILKTNLAAGRDEYSTQPASGCLNIQILQSRPGFLFIMMLLNFKFYLEYADIPYVIIYVSMAIGNISQIDQMINIFATFYSISLIVHSFDYQCEIDMKVKT